MTDVLSVFRIIIIACFLFPTCRVYSQLSKGGFPLSGTSKSFLRSSSEIPVFVMDSFVVFEESGRSGNAFAFAYKFEVDIDLKRDGEMTVLPDGTPVWRLSIRSDGAYSLNVIFSSYRVPPGASLFLYSDGMKEILGAFSYENNSPTGVFAVAPVEGDKITLEYSEPAEAEFSGSVVIGSVNHDFVGLKAGFRPKFEVSQYCTQNAVCNEEKDEQRRSSCMYIIDGRYSCSGNLVNNTAEDGCPYVLSAAHCLLSNRNFVDTLAQTCVFFFNYESGHCSNTIRGNVEMTMSGAVVVAHREERDMLLLKLKDPVPPDYMPYFAGWKVAEEVSLPAYCFHHPMGDVKKISYEDDMIYHGTFTANGLFQKDGHWKIEEWDDGITEGGSSGSSLFDADDYVVGALSGGFPDISCNVRGDDNFYRLERVWKDRFVGDVYNLKPWLDPVNMQTLSLDGREYDNPCIYLTNFRKEDDFGTLDYPFAGNNSHGFEEVAERFSCDSSSFLYGVMLTLASGNNSENGAVYVRVWSGDSVPDKLLHEERLRFVSTEYVTRKSKFAQYETSNWGAKQSYFRFAEPVKTDSSFFVSFLLPESDSKLDAFELYCAESRPDTMQNSAFFRIGDAWKEFTEHPEKNMSSALMVSAVCRNTLVEDVKEPVDSVLYDFSLYPNPIHDNLFVLFPKALDDAEINVYNSFGRLVMREFPSSSARKFCLNMSAMTAGVYYIRVSASNQKARTFKVLKQ